MGVFDKIKDPIFLKEGNEASIQLLELKALEPFLNEEGQLIIRQDIKNLEYGIYGEKNIAFELKNIHMPMYILHDVYLQEGDLSAQIDYLVFTKKLCFVIECKNLYGNIEVNNSGDFIRTTEFGNKKKKEGIYSPVTQNQRHLELMKKIKINSKGNVLLKLMTERYFEDFYKTVVVLANPKTVLNVKFAKKEIKDKVIKADQLGEYIKRNYKACKEDSHSEAGMLKWAQSYLDYHKGVKKDYTKKYDKYRIIENARKDFTIDPASVVSNIQSEKSDTFQLEDSEIFKALKKFRLDKSREEKIKPYYIYNDKQLKDLILKMPKYKNELLKVSGFNDLKVNKYGDDILSILASQ